MKVKLSMGGELEVLRTHVLYAVFRFAGAVSKALVFGSTGEGEWGSVGYRFGCTSIFVKPTSIRISNARFV